MQDKITAVAEVSKTFVQRVRTNMNMNKIGLDNSQFFEASTKLEDIKKMLEGDSDKDKLDGLKRLIAMISKGRDCSSLFPSVVKNVISKNVELKKLVYMYLVHYAELEQDSALLAINSFQKDLGNQSQYIRASALKVMSSIRVKIIVQIIMMAIQKSVKDSSPYVRKAAAHAIPKVASLDPDHKEELIEVLKTLLADRSTMVLGSAIFAWTEICPERFDLLHPHYKKLCTLLADIDEWGQILILNVLIRYARTQFEDPNKDLKKKSEGKKKSKKELKLTNSDSDDRSDSDDESSESDDDDFAESPVDPDLRMLLTQATPLLKSRNTGVVLAVSSLYYYCAPASELSKVIKSLVRISKGQREIEYVVLANIATMVANKPQVFEPFLTEFFVRPSDVSFVRNLKLEIITHLATQDNINKIMKELKTYISREEKDFVAATIQAIGRAAASVPDVTDRCLHGLMSLLSNRSETVVAESVVVIKKLLQLLTDSEEHNNSLREVVTHLAKLIDTVDTARARSAIIWVIGEYSTKVPRIAPDVLRKLAKSFPNEDPSVKLQALNLGAKLILTNPDQTRPFFDYILTLAKYDTNYDVRDRCRVFRTILASNDANSSSSSGSSLLQERAVQLILTKKPIPTEVTPSEGRQRFTVNSLSHITNHTAAGYEPLLDFPEVAPDPSVREEQLISPTASSSSPATFSSGGKKAGKKDSFWSDEDESGSDYSDESDRSSRSDSGSYSDYSDEESRSDYSDDQSDYTDSEEEQIVAPPKKSTAKTPTKAASASPVPSKNVKSPVGGAPKSLDDLFSAMTVSSSSSTSNTTKQPNSTPSLDDIFGSLPATSSNTNNASFLDNSSGNNSSSKYSGGSGLALFTSNAPKYTLLKSHLGGGLGIEFSYVRSPSMYGATFKTLELYLKNQGTKTITNISVTKLPSDAEVIPFADISELQVGESVDATLSIKFASVSQAVKFSIKTNLGEFPVSLTPNVGELVRGVTLTHEEFAADEKKLKGMHETVENITLTNVEDQLSSLTQAVLDSAYVSPAHVDLDNGQFEFAGRTMLEDGLLLVSVNINPQSGEGKIAVHCENTFLNPLLLKQLKKAILGEQ